MAYLFVDLFQFRSNKWKTLNLEWWEKERLNVISIKNRINTSPHHSTPTPPIYPPPHTNNLWHCVKTKFTDCFVVCFFKQPANEDTFLWVCKVLWTPHWWGAWKLGRLQPVHDNYITHWRYWVIMSTSHSVVYWLYALDQL